MFKDKYSHFLASQGDSPMVFLPAVFTPQPFTVLSGIIFRIYHLHPDPQGELGGQKERAREVRCVTGRRRGHLDW